MPAPKPYLIIQRENLFNAIRYLEAVEDDVKKTVKSGAEVPAQIGGSVAVIVPKANFFGRRCAFDVLRGQESYDPQEMLSALRYIEKVVKDIRKTVRP